MKFKSQNSSASVGRKVQIKRSGGFTVIEVVFVLAIFLVIVGVSIDIFISIVRHQRRILAQQELLNQSSYVSEYLSKAIRMAVVDEGGSCVETPGGIYELTHCNNGPLEACEGIKFINQSDNNACQEFFLDRMAAPEPGFFEIKNGAAAQRLLSDAFTINTLKFVINGNQALRDAGEEDLSQPRVTVLLDLKTKNTENPPQKTLQTTVSLRNLNIP